MCAQQVTVQRAQAFFEFLAPGASIPPGDER